MTKLPLRAVVAAALPVALFAQDTQNPAAAVEHLIDADTIRGATRFLSSDLLEGRGVGTRGDLLARAYLATEFERAGLQPAGPDGTWEQAVPILGILAKVTTPLGAKGAAGSRTFRELEDFTAVAGSPASTASWQGAELVFVGYGIHAPEQQWDDYKGVDLKGKVLLVMNNDPSTDDALFAGKTRLYYGRWDYKYLEAARRGAIGAIVIHTNESAGYPYQVVQANHGREAFWLPFEKDQPTIGIRSWCTEAAAKELAQLGGKDLDALRAAAERRDFAPVPLGVTVDLAIGNQVRELQSANVLGKLPGSDPALKDEVVVVTAHFDHLGRGKERNGDDIYNGALDNASGCASMLAVVRACAALPQAPRRTLLFAAVTAEESGLLGSEWYCRNPTYPKRQLIANYNIDGVAIWGESRDIEFIGHGKNSLTRLAEQVAQTRNRTLKPDANPDLGLFYRSDHFNFARIGVPAAYFKAGNEFLEQPEDRRRMKNSYTAVHYHQQSDEIAPWWNLKGAVADMRFLLECLVRTANSDEAPRWSPGDEFEKLR